MKKILSLIMSLCIIAGTFATAYADEISGGDAVTKIYEQKFSDVPENHWAFASIAEMTMRGVLNGYSDGTFRPDNTVTRAEAAKMIASIEGTYATNFSEYLSDVGKEEWHAPYVYGVKSYFNTYELQVGSGRYPAYGEFFMPDNIIEREDVVVALVKQSEGKYRPETAGNELDGFVDGYEVTEEKRPYFEKAVSKGIISGYSDNTLRPHGGLTRAEMATLLCNLYGATYSADIISGTRSHNFVCTYDVFLTRYRQNLADNYNKVAANDTDNLLGAKRYEISNTQMTLVSSDTVKKELAKSFSISEIDNYEFYSDTKTTIITDSNGIIKYVELNFNKPDEKYNRDGYRNYISPAKYQTICALMAMGNIDFEEAFSLMNAVIFSTKFSVDNKYMLTMEKTSFILIDLRDRLVGAQEETASFKTGIFQPSADNTPALDYNITQFVNNYNKYLCENFHEITEDVRYIAPEDYLLSEESIFAARQQQKLQGVEVEVNGYQAGNTTALCNKENRIISLIISGSIRYNDDVHKLDIFNLQQICAIMALENVSFDMAKGYCFASIEDESVTAENAVYLMGSYKFTAISNEFFAYSSGKLN